MLTRENFNEFIRAERTRRGMSRKELAEVFGMSHRSIEHWENGRVPARGIVEFFNWMNEEPKED